MMKLSKMNLALLLVLIFAGPVHLHSANIYPKRATGIVGGEVQINCRVEFGPNYEMTLDFNDKFVYINAVGVDTYPQGKSKYYVQRNLMNFTLTVKDLRLEDGGEYMCTSYTSEDTAFLVVLDTPSITLNPPAPIEGETAIVTCEARFGGPRKHLIVKDHSPNLKMYFEGSSPNEMLTAEPTNDDNIIRMTKNFTVHANMNKSHITCEIGTAEPFMKISDVAVLKVLLDPYKSGNERSTVPSVFVTVILVMVAAVAICY